ncbi:hypothetical protein BN946_scf184850.g5 [Trametes cinnabarina]|uniref:BTB domain-containing protein n=1 Tax=Pycnoporus cinnabarinus TaxID=5643 RepID=A0A060SPJ3_PYCCI|nr:hypothetical protein BN946_scf184850.g5 [Trametes cinnabarina]
MWQIDQATRPGLRALANKIVSFCLSFFDRNHIPYFMANPLAAAYLLPCFSASDRWSPDAPGSGCRSTSTYEKDYCINSIPDTAHYVIRTSDDVELHVYRAIIGVASSVFSDMLSLPQPAPTATSDTGVKPTIEVAESSAVWETLIMLCYAPRPPAPGDFADLDTVRAILDAGVKYEMQIAT